MLRLDNAPQAKVHADRVIASLSVCLVSQTERSIVIGSKNMTSRVVLRDWAAILQAYTKRCERFQVTLTVAVSLQRISISL